MDKLPRYSSAGHQQITNLATATSLTVPGGRISLVIVQAETQDIRWRDDGTDPTASVGTLLAKGTTMDYDGDPAKLRLIEVTPSAKANVTYYRR